MRLPYSCYALLLGGISKQAVQKSIQKTKEDVHNWFERRLKEYLVPPALTTSSSWTEQLAIDTARTNMKQLLNDVIHWINEHKRKDKRGRKSWTPQMVAKVLGVDMSNWSYANRWDVIDVYERYLNRCIDQLIKVKHLNEWEVRLPTQVVLTSKTNPPFEDPFGGAFNR